MPTSFTDAWNGGAIRASVKAVAVGLAYENTALVCFLERQWRLLTSSPD